MKKRIVMFLAAAIAAMCTSAEPTVSNETAKQRYPWNGLVDITCKVTGLGAAGDEFYHFSLAAVMPDSGEVRKMSQFWVVKNGTNSIDKTVQVHTNGDYQLVWNAQQDLGGVFYSNMVIRVTINTLRDKVQLWAGGPFWAGKNIGAQSPWECGYYFWWGDTVGYKLENGAWVASDSSSSDFSFGSSNTPTYYKSIDTLKGEGWITADGVLAPEHDAAHVQWGGSWRTPTQQELRDLNSKCAWTWTTMNGVNGYVICGSGEFASNSIFLPCAGYGRGTSLNDAGSYGLYWSSLPGSDLSNYYRAWSLYFGSSLHDTNCNYRDIGRSVRPVQGFTE